LCCAQCPPSPWIVVVLFLMWSQPSNRHARASLLHNTSLGYCLDLLSDEAYAISAGPLLRHSKLPFDVTWMLGADMETRAA
jgi:hypothetical protein